MDLNIKEKLEDLFEKMVCVQDECQHCCFRHRRYEDPDPRYDNYYCFFASQCSINNFSMRKENKT